MVERSPSALHSISSPSRRSPYQGRLRLVCALLGTLLALTLAVAAITRPIDRGRLPRTVQDARNELAALHHGEGECARWPRDHVLSKSMREAFFQDVETHFALDLHTLLPLLSHLRDTNVQAAQQHHTHTPRDEFVQVALARLDAFDRKRLEIGSHNLEKALPAVGYFRENPQKQVLDRSRAQRLLRALTPEEQKALAPLLETWRVPLAHRRTQADLLHRAAEKITQQRMDALHSDLKRYHTHYGRLPLNFRELLGFLRRTHSLSGIVERGIEVDNSMRDGWIRPLEYYTLPNQGYHLRSQGASEGSNEDDITVEHYF